MTIIALCALLQAVIAAVLIVHEDYEDGLVGRIALGGVILAGVVVVLSEIHDARYTAPPELVLLLVSNSLFMSRHLFRFLRWNRNGAHSWKPRIKDRKCQSS